MVCAGGCHVRDQYGFWWFFTVTGLDCLAKCPIEMLSLLMQTKQTKIEKGKNLVFIRS